jgi:SPP1 family predicted phage head-tail adaptor
MADRRQFNRLLTERCDIARKTVTKGTSGEKTGTLAPVATAVPCFPGNPTGRANLTAIGLNPALTKVFAFAFDQDVKVGDQITYNGRKYQVKYQIDGGGSAGHHLEFYAETTLGG